MRPRGSCLPLAPGVYRLRWPLPRDPESGKRRSGSSVFHGTERQARRELNRCLAEAEAGAVPPARQPLRDFLNSWLDTNRPRLAPGSVETYAAMIRRLVARLGEVPLGRLSPLQIQQHYAEEAKAGLAPASIALQHSVLRRALRQARRWKLIPVVPTDDVDPPRAVPPDIEIPALADLRRFLALTEGSPIRVPVLLAILTGLRRGEVLGLQWEDVDWQAGTVSVRRSLRRGEAGLEYGYPKSKASRRTMRLPALALEELCAHRDAQAEVRKLLDGEWQEFGLIFPREDGRPWHPSTFSGAYRRAREAAGFPDLRYHDLRHVNLSQLHALGVPQRVIAARAGHADPGLTLRRYTHLLPGQDTEAAEKLDQAFRQE